MKNQFTLVLLIVFCLNLNAQPDDGSKRYYNDFSLDYFPMIQSRMSPNSTMGMKVAMDGELIEVLNIYLRELLDYDFSINRIGGMRMLSGMMPQELIDNTWIRLKFDYTGRIVKTKIYYRATLNESLSEELFKMLLDSKFLPALKNGEPVNSLLYYLVVKKGRNRKKRTPNNG